MIDAIEQRMEFDAAPDRVWRALTDGDELASWFPDAAFDLAPNANGAFVWEKYGSYAVRVERFEPPSVLAWRWAHKPDTDIDVDASTLVEFTLQARDDGGTILELRETGFATEAARQDNVNGWKHELAELAELLAA